MVDVSSFTMNESDFPSLTKNTIQRSFLKQPANGETMAQRLLKRLSEGKNKKDIISLTNSPTDTLTNTLTNILMEEECSKTHKTVDIFSQENKIESSEEKEEPDSAICENSMNDTKCKREETPFMNTHTSEIDEGEKKNGTTKEKLNSEIQQEDCKISMKFGDQCDETNQMENKEQHFVEEELNEESKHSNCSSNMVPVEREIDDKLEEKKGCIDTRVKKNRRKRQNHRILNHRKTIENLCETSDIKEKQLLTFGSQYYYLNLPDFELFESYILKDWPTLQSRIGENKLNFLSHHYQVYMEGIPFQSEKGNDIFPPIGLTLKGKHHGILYVFMTIFPILTYISIEIPVDNLIRVLVPDEVLMTTICVPQPLVPYFLNNVVNVFLKYGINVSFIGTVGMNNNHQNHHNYHNHHRNYQSSRFSATGSVLSYILTLAWILWKC